LQTEAMCLIIIKIYGLCVQKIIVCWCLTLQFLLKLIDMVML
jgi:hypothetical protein